MFDQIDAVAASWESVADIKDRLIGGDRVEFASSRFNERGHRIWLELEIQTVRTSGGAIDKFIAIARDTSERRWINGTIAALQTCDTILFESANLREAAERLLPGLGTPLAVESATYWEVERGTTRIAPQFFWRPPPGHPASSEPARADDPSDPDWSSDSIAEQLLAAHHEAGRLAHSHASAERCCTVEPGCLHVATPRGFGWAIVDRDGVLGGFSFVTHQRNEGSGELSDLLSNLNHKVRAFVDRKQAEEDRNRLAAIVEASDDFFSLCDPTGRIIWRNAAYLKFLGRTAGSVPTGSPFDSNYEDWAVDRLRNEAIPEATRTGSWLGETAIRAVDGRVIPLSHRLVAQRDAEGHITSFASILRDITTVKAAEAELRVAKEAAEAASRAKSEFLANMSHEIRTPMNGILGMTDLTLDTELNSLQREYLGLVRASGESLLHIINDILDFSKIEAGRLELELVEFHLVDLIYETLRPLALRAHAAELDLICHVDPDIPEVVRGDPLRLRQVLVNLVGNAVKFTPRGEVLVRVVRSDPDSTTDADDGDNSIALTFRIADTGVGVPPNKLQAIFEPFTQADGSTSRTYGGSGLGLTISSEIVHLMRGRLGVESELGRGSTFSFEARLGLVVPTTVGVSYAALQGRRVLVAVANPTRRHFILDDLNYHGMRTFDVAGGLSALDELLRAQKAGLTYDVALIDDHLPDLDVLDLIRVGHANSRLQPTQLVILTTTGRSGLIHAHDSALARCIPKPVAPRKLLETLLTTLTQPHDANTPDSLALDPRPRNVAEVATGGRETDLTPAPSSRTIAPLRILLAEDQLVNRKVQDGREVLNLLRGAWFDVVMMDIQMPVMDGFEAAETIRRTFAEPIYLVALTAHALKGDRERCLAAGFDDYLSKPLTSEDLRVVLSRLGNARRPPELLIG